MGTGGWWKNPFIVVPSIVAIVVAVLGAVLPILLTGEEPIPEVELLGAPEAKPGQEVVITGKNLNLVSEVLLVGGDGTLFPLLFRIDSQARLVIIVSDKLAPGEFSLGFKTIERKDIATGKTLRVASLLPTQTSTPNPVPTTAPALSETPTSTPIPTLESSPTARSKPTTTPEPAPAQSPGLGFQDDFSDPKSGFPERSTQNEEYGYVGGEFRILIKKAPNRAAWATVSRSFCDLDLQVKARYQGPAIAKNYGLVFRYEDTDNFYNFRVDPILGKYNFRRRDRGAFSTALVGWTPSPHINVGNKPNLLRVVARGPTIELYANSFLLHTLVNPTFTCGKIGLYGANEDDPGGAEIYFDDFEVRDLK